MCVRVRESLCVFVIVYVSESLSAAAVRWLRVSLIYGRCQSPAQQIAQRESVCARVREGVRESVCARVREKACVRDSVCASERQRVSESLCMCVCI